MVGRAKPTTRDEKARLAILKENCPCLPCLLAVRLIRLPSIQHLVEGMKRLGHDQTYTACNWHHFGDTDGHPKQEIMGLLGPSLAHGKRTYQAFFGSERSLVEIQDHILDQYYDYPWLDYSVPDFVIRGAVELWRKKKQ